MKRMKQIERTILSMYLLMGRNDSRAGRRNENTKEYVNDQDKQSSIAAHCRQIGQTIFIESSTRVPSATSRILTLATLPPSRRTYKIKISYVGYSPVN